MNIENRSEWIKITFRIRKYPVLDAALRYYRAVLSCLPIQRNGSKFPLLALLPRVQDPRDPWRFRHTWKPFTKQLPTEDQLKSWFRRPWSEVPGIAIVCGLVSGGLEVADFDDDETYERWRKTLTPADRHWFDRIIWVQSPRPGRHGYFRSKCCGKSQKLAQRQVLSDDGQPTWKTLVEVKGEGGIVLAPPSPGACHPTGRTYRVVSDQGLEAVSMLTAEARTRLFESIRVFDERPPKTRSVQLRSSSRSLILPQTTPYAFGLRPGDDYNARGDWFELLTKHGWNCVGDGAADCTYWARPGKNVGTSATLNYEGSGRLYVFSSNAAPFEDQRSYSLFEAFAYLEHAGDFSAAAQALRAQGYGDAAHPLNIVLPSWEDEYRDLQLPDSFEL
ncbi:MAG: bifunctional DNA primase/polymerase [Pirellulales bacterium]